MTIRHLTYRLVHNSEMGVPTLAEAMGKSHQILNNKLNVNSDSHLLSIDEFETIGDFLDVNLEYATYFATKANAVVVQLPEDAPTGDMALLDSFMQCVESNGSIAKEFKAAFADGRIDDHEFEAIKKAMYDTVADQMAFLKMIEGVKR